MIKTVDIPEVGIPRPYSTPDESKQQHADLAAVQDAALVALDRYVQDGWTILHVSQVQDRHGWSSIFYLFKKPI